MEFIMTWVELAVFENAAGGAAPFPLISEVLLASLFAATLLAEVCGERSTGKTFTHRFAYAYWRYALPACVFSALIYELFWR
jgi:hypothetical protein